MVYTSLLEWGSYLLEAKQNFNFGPVQFNICIENFDKDVL